MLVKETGLREAAEAKLQSQQEEFQKQLSILQREADLGKEHLRTVEGQLQDSEARTTELAQRFHAEKTLSSELDTRLAVELTKRVQLDSEVQILKAEAEKLNRHLDAEVAANKELEDEVSSLQVQNRELTENLSAVENQREAIAKKVGTLQEEVDSFPDQLQAEQEEAEDQALDRFLFTMWKRHPEIDYSFFGTAALESIRIYEEARVAENPASSSAVPGGQAARQGTGEGPDGGSQPEE